MSRPIRITLFTLAAVLACAFFVSARADAYFQRETDALVRRMFARVRSEPASIVTTTELASLPEPVRRWLEASGVVGRPRVRCVRLRQRGALRTAPQQAFMPARADQYFSVEPPAFVWRVHVPMWHVLPIVGRDSFADGKGRMLIEAAALIPMVDASGTAIDQGTLSRFLGEIVWFPSAALSPRLHWESVDANSARATMSDRGVTASAVFRFDASGRFIAMHAARFMSSDTGARLTPWNVEADQWRAFHGVQVPVHGSVSWQLPAGVFTYYRWQITDIDYDVPAVYER